MTAVATGSRVPQRSQRGRAVLVGSGLLLLASLTVEVLYVTVPKSNEGSGPVDALLVLGTPAGLRGELTNMQRWRTDSAIQEFRAGRAPRILFSGGPTSHGVFEADVMAAYARQQDVPSAAILEERHSFTTLQNIQNSTAILRSHGWHSVEVVSTVEHLPRAAVLLEKSGLRWRTHAASTPGRSRSEIVTAHFEEAVGTAVLRVFGTRAEPVLHGLSMAQHRVAWCVRWVVYWLEARSKRR